MKIIKFQISLNKNESGYTLMILSSWLKLGLSSTWVSYVNFDRNIVDFVSWQFHYEKMKIPLDKMEVYIKIYFRPSFPKYSLISCELVVFDLIV